MQNYLTIDVEDYYQVAAFDNVIKQSDWNFLESRVCNNVQTILETLDKYNIKATFFVVGWIAEKHPDVVLNILGKKHEIACHSYLHRKIYTMTKQDFFHDTKKSKDILENITGNKIFGYRAPSYSITEKTLWALDILEELGFEYDSSIFPIYHDLYGIPNAPRFEYKIPNHNLMEYPVSTIRLLNKNIPISGGGYFRLFPYSITKLALKHINEKEQKPFVFYLHPWEIDYIQPRIKKAKFLSRFRHYLNLNKTLQRFGKLLNDFKFRPIHS
ncbi:MAG: DUF3473 domain-containing protein [Desulfobacterales bacterium]|nr:DUF3473 domain-containing protein [Desulfobacterales bacterium]